MTATPRVLALDVGSQSVRAALFTRDGTMTALAARPAPVCDSPQPGFAQVDPAQFFDQLRDACQDLALGEPDQWSSVAGVALASQRATMVFMDADDRPSRPAILWSDQRTCEPSGGVGGIVGLGIAVAGARSIVRDLRARAPAAWVALNEPGIWANTRTVALLSSYLNFRLTGEWVDSSGSQVGYLPFDFRRHRWHGPRNWRWRALGPLVPQQLVALRPPCAALGRLQADSARALSLPPSTPVFAAAADKACEVLGAGCVDSTTACLSYGTAATVNIPHERYGTVRRFLPAYPAAQPQRFLSEVQIHRGFWLVTWFLREFGLSERQKALRDGVAVETLLETLLEDSRAGARGLVAQPYFTPGVLVPGPEARGALIGFLEEHTRAHVYRALIEGLIFELRHALEYLEKRRGWRVDEVIVAGGGSASDAIMQITADILGRAALRPGTSQCTSLGAAMCAAVGLGWHADIHAAVRKMCRDEQRFVPTAASASVYEPLFRDVYRPLYRRLRPLYRRLLRIAR